MKAQTSVALLLCAVGSIGCGGVAALDAPAGQRAQALSESNRRYDQVRQKSAHNSYQRYEALLDQLVYHRIRSLELDIHVGKTGWSEIPGNWYVYHADIVDAGTTCHRLSDCLTELRAFHQANPSHEVVTVWIDLKDGWKTGFNPADLDNRIAAHIPTSWIFRPADLLAACPGATTLQQAVTGSCDWPLLSAMQGKFIFALTGGDVASSTTRLNTYVSSGTSAATRTAFIAPDLTTSTVGTIPSKSYVTFFNMNISDVTAASNVNAAGFISRVWGIGSSTEWSSAKTYFAHHLGTDKVNFHQDPWAATHNAKGWPFECFSACSSTLSETVRAIGVQVNSEDIWGSSDHFRFLTDYSTADGNLWTATISTPNSHVEEWAKGCLMARSSATANSPYVAVCRAADNHKLRIQWRSSPGGSSSASDVDIAPADTIDQESLTFVRLYVYNNNTCAAGYGSQDGISWTLIGYKCPGYALNYQGAATSSHGNAAVKFIYGNLARNGAAVTLANLPYAYSFGTVRSASAFDGVFP